DLHMKENWSGTVALQSGEIGDDFAYYYTLSEQTPSAVSLGVLVDSDYSILASGGLLIQMMPDAQEEDITYIEKIVANMKHISTYIKEFDSLEDILHDLFEEVNILSKQDIEFRCGCDASIMKRVLTTLSKKERLAMIEEDHGCEITCNFCNEKYQFSEQELLDLERFLDQHAK
ncbi:MAG: Hsp33 family molecular chaperone HslO, partial [Longicatena sp.]